MQDFTSYTRVSALALTVIVGLASTGPALGQTKNWLFSDDNCVRSDNDTAANPGTPSAQCDGFANFRSFVEQGHGTGEGHYGGSGDLVHLSGWATTADKHGQRNNALEQGLIIDGNDATGSYGLRNADWNRKGDDRDHRENKAKEGGFDNNQRQELLLLEFDQAWVLTDITTDTADLDADLSVLYYTGDAPVASGSDLVSNQTFSELLASGWNLLGHYATRGPFTGTYDIQDTSADPSSLRASSYWLVGTYIPGLGGSCFGINVPDCSTQIGGHNDRFRISAVGASTQTAASVAGVDVPEPWTVLLLAAGLPFVVRKRRSAAASLPSNPPFRRVRH